MRMYKLVGTTPVEVSDISEVEWSMRSLKKTAVGRDIVSTAFLGIDHSFRDDDGPPVLFETMIFGSRLDGEQHRSCTYEEAMRQHHYAVLCLVELKRQWQQGLIDLVAGTAGFLLIIFA